MDQDQRELDERIRWTNFHAGSILYEWGMESEDGFRWGPVWREHYEDKWRRMKRPGESEDFQDYILVKCHEALALYTMDENVEKQREVRRIITRDFGGVHGELLTEKIEAVKPFIDDQVKMWAGVVDKIKGEEA